MKKIFALLIVSMFLVCSVSEAGFGGSRGGFSGSRGSSFSGSRSSGSSFGGSRSSGSTSRSSGSSFGGSRSSPSKSYTSPSKPSSGSSFGGSRGSSSPAPIVRNNNRSSGGSVGSTTTVNHYYGGSYYGGYHPFYGYYGSPYYGGGFWHGFMWGQFFNRPQVVYVGGTAYVGGNNGQPMLDAQGQPIVYQTNPPMTALAFLVWMLILGTIGYVTYNIYRSYANG